jgi:hypothetical protein
MSGTYFGETVSEFLPAALELMTAYLASTDSPDLYWQVLNRVVGESESLPADEVILGLSALSSILLEQLALHSGLSRSALLAHFHQIYLSPIGDNR